MVHNLIDTEGIEFLPELADVELLNKRAAEDVYDVCKLSYSTFFSLCDKYVMLRSGSALGYNNGPLFVSLDPVIGRESYSNLKIAIPGDGTTGALLLRNAFPECRNLTPILFSEIEKRVLRREFDAGVLIHEGRFTYKEKGLHLIEDLGSYWQNTTGFPIPLGGIAVSRRLDKNLQQIVNRILKRSIEFAFAHPDKSAGYVSENAQEMDMEVQRKHIALFVNDYTLDIGDTGINAVEALYNKALELNPGVIRREDLFI
ncbi:MAG: 1,4-dihydroxy-6-naphthoate synthase [Bacteroidales bacterium]|nr:1,4-dihydroxy-6-naphthoate synthase [Bacteroidales bacterium]